ncbi:MAG: T9SS type A sorting domain-containing protein [Candidatus Delongbacteria bacterium]|nr:T9SS type A sorting domain-containing protein [Candidatus Delongbacteria bacterium]MBN2834864.1 T9SS type A sorting domain-containing protein [Candidatus Delongbacteria bacterium]
MKRTIFLILFFVVSVFSGYYELDNFAEIGAFSTKGNDLNKQSISDLLGSRDEIFISYDFELLKRKMEENNSFVDEQINPLSKRLENLVHELFVSNNSSKSISLNTEEIKTLLSSAFDIKENELIFYDLNISEKNRSIENLSNMIMSTYSMIQSKYESAQPLIDLKIGDKILQKDYKRTIDKFWIIPISSGDEFRIVLVAKFKIIREFGNIEPKSIKELRKIDTSETSTKQNGSIVIETSHKDYIPNETKDRSKIMVTGFWNPTGQMIAPFSTDVLLNPEGWIGEDWENLGYDIYSFFPEPGTYVGDLEVDYQDVTEDFWNITSEIKPIAILSFGAGAGPWEIEFNARNITSWVPDYVAPTLPTPNPPDNTKPVSSKRLSSLPVEEIALNVNSETSINAWVDWNGNPGAFLCEYMAYHSEWYQSIERLNPEFPCLSAGFIHVNSSISYLNAREAFLITLRTIIEYLDTFIPISGVVSIAGGDSPIGTTITFEGNETFTIEIDNEMGTIELANIAPGEYEITAIKGDSFLASETIYIDENSNFLELQLTPWENINEISYHGEQNELFTYNYNYPVELAIKITPEEFSSFIPGLLSKVSFLTPDNSDNSDISVVVYSSTLQSSFPQVLEYSNYITDYQAEEWYDHNILTPLTLLDTKSYWVGYSISSPSQTFGWYDDIDLYQNKGAWIKRSSWSQLSTLAGINHNWMIDCTILSEDSTSINDQNIPKSLDMRTYPNPFNPSINLEYLIGENSDINLSIYNIYGEKVIQLENEFKLSGNYKKTWNGVDGKGKSISSGTYFAKLISNNNVLIKKIILVK